MSGSTFEGAPTNGEFGCVISVEWVRSDVAVVALRGELDMATVPEATVCIEQVISERATHVLLDLAEVEFFGSAAVGMLMDVHETMAPPRQLYLVGVASNIKVGRVLEFSGVRLLFGDHDDVAAVLQRIDEKA